MQKLKNTKKIQETEFHCDFCNRYFQKETSLMRHMCETKHRWQSKDLPGNRIAFQTWQDFYRKNTATKKQKTYLDFAKSAYYIAFLKYANYCIDIKCINIALYTDWLLKNQIKIDSWTSDSVYERFLIDFLKHEDPFDAIARSIETTIEYAAKDNIETKDYLRYGNKNRICSLIINGKISPWMIYQSESGIKFLESLDSSQQKMIMEYINPEKWALTFRKNNDIVKQVKELLAMGKY
jgi:hypothetical protein